MRALVVAPGPHFSVFDVHNGLIAGLRHHGIDTESVSLDRYLDFFSAAHVPDMDTGELKLAFKEPRDAARASAVAALEPVLYEHWPHLVIVVSGFFLDPTKYQLMRSRGHKVVLWCTESPYEDERQAWMASLADVVIVNDPTNLDMFRAVNKNTFYIPHSYDPTIHTPVGPSRESDFCFVGTGYPSRIEWLEKCDFTGLDFALAGNWTRLADDSPLRPYVIHPIEHCLENTEAVEWYRGTKASLNIYRKEAMRGVDEQGWACGPREIELAACGTFFFREPRGESDELFPMLPTVGTPAEFSEELRWWLNHDDLRREAATKAQAAIADRTFANNVRELFQLIESTT